MNNAIDVLAGLPVWVWWLSAFPAIALWGLGGKWTCDRIVKRFINKDHDRFGLFMLACYGWTIYWPLRFATRPAAWLRRWWRGRKAVTVTAGYTSAFTSNGVSKFGLIHADGDVRIDYLIRYVGDGDLCIEPMPEKPAPYAASAKALGSKVPGAPVTREELDVVDRATMANSVCIDSMRNEFDRRLAALEAAQPGRGEGVRVFVFDNTQRIHTGDSMWFRWQDRRTKVWEPWWECGEWEDGGFLNHPNVRSGQIRELTPGSEEYERIVAEWRKRDVCDACHGPGYRPVDCGSDGLRPLTCPACKGTGRNASKTPGPL